MSATVAIPASAPEVSLPAAARLRASLLGLVIALLGLGAAAVGGLLIVAGLFHTSLGSLG